MARTALVYAAVGATLTAASFVLNPSADQHRSRIQEAVAERSPLAGVLGVGRWRLSRPPITPWVWRLTPRSTGAPCRWGRWAWCSCSTRSSDRGQPIAQGLGSTE